MNFGVDLFRLYENHKKESEAAGNYETAATTALRLHQMRTVEQKRQKASLAQRHKTELEALEAAQVQAKLELVEAEKAAVGQLLAHESEQHAKLRARHAKELENVSPPARSSTRATTSAGAETSNSTGSCCSTKDEQEGHYEIATKSTTGGFEAAPERSTSTATGSTNAATAVTKQKPTAEILQLETRLKHIVSQGLYAKARKIAQQKQMLVQEQEARATASLPLEAETKASKLAQKHQAERDALEARLRRGRDCLRRNQEDAFQQLQLRQAKALANLQTKHRCELAQLEAKCRNTARKQHAGILQDGSEIFETDVAQRLQGKTLLQTTSRENSPRGGRAVPSSHRSPRCKSPTFLASGKLFEVDRAAYSETSFFNTSISEEFASKELNRPPIVSAFDASQNKDSVSSAMSRFTAEERSRTLGSGGDHWSRNPRKKF
ncbi:unnamed protein product [Amoebophrya sp. A120]|nr:unnamed protein product [Amoebophrya sp. A120]|eukprot:GSA120T00010596001.1